MNIKFSDNAYKLCYTSNPISPNVFCADPTCVEYEGRLYIYGTNDHQQYEAVGDEGKNSYEKIKSLVVFSTDDMANYEYHGIINTEKIAPWIYNSWAPSIVSRVESDGLTHFYLYFSNNGNGVGVITATHPLGPWSDPLGKPLVYQGMPDLENCPAPFDPGVLIDDMGTGWLAFGGGVEARGDNIHTKVPKIVRLGKDLLSFDSEFVSIDAPYFFEASELNFENGTYIYTYSTDWQSRDKWDRQDINAPAVCSMGCLTTKTPLDSDSWEFKGGFFLNAGESGMEWCNNHTHLAEFKGTKYILHHTMHIQERMTTKGGFRCMCVDYLPYSDKDFPITKATRQGVSQIKSLNPYTLHSGSEMFTCADVWYEEISLGKMAVKSLKYGAWTYIKSVEFSKETESFTLKIKGNGCIGVYLDSENSQPIGVVETFGDKYKEVSVTLKEKISGIHNLYFAFSSENICLESWQAK
ncbi:MAG: family 43 glycosylhydrolase [Oscillospiraceae bacterium]|nr:family 43 glycosylhydrolase [Oscillospiraceae bacterium]